MIEPHQLLNQTDCRRSAYHSKLTNETKNQWKLHCGLDVNTPRALFRNPGVAFIGDSTSGRGVDWEFTGSANTARKPCDMRRREEWRFVIGLKLPADETIVLFSTHVANAKKKTGCIVRVCVCAVAVKGWCTRGEDTKRASFYPRDPSNGRSRLGKSRRAAIRRFNFRLEVQGTTGASILAASRQRTNIPSSLETF